MLGYLAGVPGRLKTLLDRLSAPWAAQLDTLHTLLSSTWAAKLDSLRAAYTDGKAAFLDVAISSRAAETTPILDVPSAAIVGASYSSFAGAIIAANGASHFTTSTTFVDAVNYTGAGVLEGVLHSISLSVGGHTHYLEVLIDGVTFVSISWSESGGSHLSCAPVGSLGISYDNTGNPHAYLISCGSVPFKSSLQIRHRVSNASAVSDLVVSRFRKTA